MEDERHTLGQKQANLRRRALIYELIRAFFRRESFLEVETPVRVPAIAPEACIVPFYSDDWLLSTSPELHMKRLLAAGYAKLFQLSRCFRRGERGRWHNPEFTMLEWYRAGADYAAMIRDTERLISAVAHGLGLGSGVIYQGSRIDLAPPWQRVTVREAFGAAAGWDPVARLDAVRFDIDLVEKVIPRFSREKPLILLDYPAGQGSLARLKPGDPAVAERAEVFIAGLELANAYSELNDRREQERRFAAEIEQIRVEQGRTAAMPHRFLDAMEHLPECGGIALGVDRLVMLFCDAAAIDEVVAFTVDTA